MGLWDKFKDWKKERDFNIDYDRKARRWSEPNSKPTVADRARDTRDAIGQGLKKGGQAVLGGVASVFKGAKEGWGRFRRENQRRAEEKRNQRLAGERKKQGYDSLD
jgi:hypothetical protein